MMAMTTLLSGFFWGMMRAVVLTSMHFQMLGLKQVIIRWRCSVEIQRHREEKHGGFASSPS